MRYQFRARSSPIGMVARPAAASAAAATRESGVQPVWLAVGLAAPKRPLKTALVGMPELVP